MDGITMPYDEDAEVAVLSAMLINPEAPEIAFGEIRGKDFYRTAHQWIFLAMWRVKRDGSPIDPVMLVNRLKEMGKLDSIGGASYVSWLMDGTPMSMNVAHHCKAVRSMAIKRRLIELLNEAGRKVMESDYPLDRLLDKLSSRVTKMGDRLDMKVDAFSMNDIMAETIEQMEESWGSKKAILGLPTGFSRLDMKTSGMNNGDLIVLAGRPSMGKTAMALQMIEGAIHQAPAVFYSLEMAKTQLTYRLLSQGTGMSVTTLRRACFEKERWQDVMTCAGKWAETQLTIVDSGDITVEGIRRSARKLKKEGKCGLVVIDHLQLMSSNTNIQNRNVALGEYSKQMKAMAKELDIPVVLLCQLRRVEDRNPPKPRLSDLRESGDIEQNADNVYLIYRPGQYRMTEKYEGETELYVAKQRQGPVGKVMMKFLGGSMRFEEVDFRKEIEADDTQN